MSKNYNDMRTNSADDILAKNWEASGGFVLKPIQSPAAKGVKEEPVPDVKDFEDCQPSTCPCANRCKLLAFREQAASAPIIGLTQERFLILRDSGQLSSVLYRIGVDGRPRPRRCLIFDEKFQMAQINVLDKNTIDEASKELTRLIQKKGVSDQQVRHFQQRLSYLIDRPYQQLRSKLRLEVNQKMEDIQIGFCDMKDADFIQKMEYEEFRSSV